VSEAAPTNRQILHVDINSYFATVLQQENPYLRGKPLGVVKSLGRTCLIATSKEAKKLGVKTGCSLPEARRLAPHLVTAAAEFERYLDCTKRLKRLFESFSPDTDIFSLDETFMDLTHCHRLYATPRVAAERIRRQIKRELGEWVTCNIGISHNRLLAKIASEISPPDSIFEITPENQDAILAQVEFKDVCGVGPRLEKKLKKLGIDHPYALNFWSEEDLQPFFGPFWTKELKRIGAGEESHILRLIDRKRDDQMKGVGRTITGYRLCDDEFQIKQTLYNLTEELIYKVRQMKMSGRHIGIGLWGEDHYWFAHRTLKYYVNHTSELFHLLYDGLYGSWQRNFKVIKYGVFLNQLQPNAHLPQCWLPEWQKREKVSRAIDTLTEKYGLFTVKPATLTNFSMIRPEVTGFLGDKKFQFR
jgi:DNA polymerase-4